ncbi:hypothetical protein N7510_009097 [Penicillium lagena]|uniref:uncharacterized protein n=1 Tax=Penicillium lagena TaxID=94218 RepID=UPI00253F6B0B|nr:uncharacterized protein N7510_009097 [Penicillium lagena]KAJ5606316.1 hypothetical protein N7510_009097 [Penicillium lagena]
MFRIALRRTGASASNVFQCTTRSICTDNARPTLLSRHTIHVNTLLTPRLPRPRHFSLAQRIRRSFREASKGIWRKNPILLPLAILSVVGGVATFAYISYVELTQVAPQYSKFPPPVADALRTGVYYTEINLNAPKALKAYKAALRMALEMGMHPFSDEVMGIKLQVAMMLEKAGLMKPAIEVLERTKTEALEWVEGLEKETAAPDVLRKEDKSTPSNVNVQIDDAVLQDAEKVLKETQEFEARQRTKTLQKVIGIEMKLAELYSSDYIQEDQKAEAAQVAAVELCLKEMHRRQKLGLPVGGGGSGGSGNSDGSDADSWLSLPEIATALTELATTYSAKERHELAMPLYMRALEMIRVTEGDSPSCKQVVLLNDVASAMAGQAQRPTAPPRSWQQKQQQQQQQPVSREQTIEAARQWAQKALDVAARIQPPVRDEECDITCVVATYNLGELAELQNKPNAARQLYIEAQSLAKGLQYEEGIAMTDAALERVSKK